jgi:hypothetical protein
LKKLKRQYLWQYLRYLSLPFGNRLLVQRSHHLVSCGLHLAGLYTVQETKNSSIHIFTVNVYVGIIFLSRSQYVKIKLKKVKNTLFSIFAFRQKLSFYLNLVNIFVMPN